MILLQPCAFLWLGYSVANSNDSLLNKAQELFENGDFHKAAVEYERLIFYAESDQTILPKLLLKKKLLLQAKSSI